MNCLANISCDICQHCKCPVTTSQTMLTMTWIPTCSVNSTKCFDKTCFWALQHVVIRNIALKLSVLSLVPCTCMGMNSTFPITSYLSSLKRLVKDTYKVIWTPFSVRLKKCVRNFILCTRRFLSRLKAKLNIPSRLAMLGRGRGELRISISGKQKTIIPSEFRF